MPLSRADVVTDSAGNNLTLTEGMPVHVYESDTDWYGRDDYLLADGIATWRDNAHGRGPMWCVQLDERGVRHESEEPEFEFPAMTAGAMRERMYQTIERTIAEVPEPDRMSVKYRVSRWVDELRHIDSGERS